MSSPNPFDQQQPISGVKNIIVVGSGKGGVGKSTVAANLALSLKGLGNKVGLLDADIYGPSLPRMFGALNQRPEVNEHNKVQPITRYGIKLMSMGFLTDEDSAVVWRGPMLFKAMEQFFRDVTWGELDYLVIDLPPGTGDVALTIAQKIPVAGAITVCTPQNLALIDAKKAIDMFNRVKIPHLGVVENMAYYRQAEGEAELELFPRGELNTYLDANRIEKLTVLPFHPSVGLGSESGIPTFESAPDSVEGKCFAELAKKVEERIH